MGGLRSFWSPTRKSQWNGGNDGGVGGAPVHPAAAASSSFPPRMKSTWINNNNNQNNNNNNNQGGRRRNASRHRKKPSPLHIQSLMSNQQDSDRQVISFQPCATAWKEYATISFEPTPDAPWLKQKTPDDTRIMRLIEQEQMEEDDSASKFYSIASSLPSMPPSIAAVSPTATSEHLGAAAPRGIPSRVPTSIVLVQVMNSPASTCTKGKRPSPSDYLTASGQQQQKLFHSAQFQYPSIRPKRIPRARLSLSVQEEGASTFESSKTAATEKASSSDQECTTPPPGSLTSGQELENETTVKDAAVSNANGPLLPLEESSPLHGSGTTTTMQQQQQQPSSLNTSLDASITAGPVPIPVSSGNVSIQEDPPHPEDGPVVVSPSSAVTSLANTAASHSSFWTESSKEAAVLCFPAGPAVATLPGSPEQKEPDGSCARVVSPSSSASHSSPRGSQHCHHHQQQQHEISSTRILPSSATSLISSGSVNEGSSGKHDPIQAIPLSTASTSLKHANKIPTRVGIPPEPNPVLMEVDDDDDGACGKDDSMMPSPQNESFQQNASFWTNRHIEFPIQPLVTSPSWSSVSHASQLSTPPRPVNFSSVSGSGSSTSIAAGSFFPHPNSNSSQASTVVMTTPTTTHSKTTGRSRRDGDKNHDMGRTNTPPPKTAARRIVELDDDAALHQANDLEGRNNTDVQFLYWI